jgi:putative tricarboxylic transport membrane protein
MPTSHQRLPGELTFALAMLLFGLTALWQAWRISGFSGWSTPGVFPMLAAAAMVASALAFLPATLRGKAPETTADQPLWRRFFDEITPLPIILFTVLIIAYMLTLERLGFIVGSFAFLVASMFVLGDRRILRITVVSALSLAIIYVIFQTAFSVVLPQGVLRGIL